ncbi:RWP-RK domain-containing protein [Carex rostrata]
MEFDLHFNRENVPLDWSFATDSLSDITEIASAEGVLVPLPDCIGHQDFKVTEFYPYAIPLASDHSFLSNNCLPWYNLADENSPTDTFCNGILPPSDYLVHDTNIQILEPLPLPPVLTVSDAIYTGKSAVNEAVLSQSIYLSETNLNFEEKVLNRAEERMIIDKRETGRARLADIGYNDIKRYFYMPITQAAKEMNVGLTILKKRCRELGIPRWPHRKMKSLRSLIRNVQELGKSSTVHEMAELEALERLIEENPEMQLTEKTKKLRQACFKANYKKRRGQLTYYQPRF